MAECPLHPLALRSKEAAAAADGHLLFGFARDMVRAPPPAIELVANQREHHMQGFDIEIRDRVTSLVKAILEQNSLPAELSADARLVDAGLTSMDMVSLMLSVEAEFDFTIPQDQITPDNFQSVATLERMVAGQLRQRQAA
jgi:acyl carrier protein